MICHKKLIKNREIARPQLEGVNVRNLKMMNRKALTKI